MRTIWSVLHVEFFCSTLMTSSNPHLSMFSKTRVRYWQPLLSRTMQVTGIVTMEGFSFPPSMVRLICLALKVEGIIFITSPTPAIVIFFYLLGNKRLEPCPYGLYSISKYVSGTSVKKRLPAERNASVGKDSHV